MGLNTIQCNYDRAKLREENQFKETNKARVQKRTIHRAHPNHPKNVSFSLRKKDDKMAQMTTDSAPSGVWSCD